MAAAIFSSTGIGRCCRRDSLDPPDVTGLNGVRGEIIKSEDQGLGRCGVKTATGGELALKPVNLRLTGALTGPAAGAPGVPDPRSSTSARPEDRVIEAAMWLKTALLQACTWRTFSLMQTRRTRRWLISKITSPVVWRWDVTGVKGANKDGARTRRCSRAAAAV